MRSSRLYLVLGVAALGGLPAPARAQGAAISPVPPAVEATAPAGPASGWQAPIPTSDGRPLHALSLYGRGLFAPTELMSVALQASPAVTSGAFGASYTYRRGTLDIVTSLDMSFLSPPDGNFLAAGKNASVDTHWVHFDNLNMVSLDVAFYWVKDLHPNVAFVFGGGIGLGVVLGDVWVVNNSGAGCAASPGDASKCHPVVNPTYYTLNSNPAPTWTDGNGKVQALSGELSPGDPSYHRKLDGLAASQQNCLAKNGGDCRDTAEHPYYHKAIEKPPVMVIVNLQIGLKFKIHRHFNFNVMGGFRDGLILGGGPEYVF